MHTADRVDKYDETLPPGYRLRAPDELTVAGDIYFSTKWYRVPERVAGAKAGEYAIVATKIDPTREDNVRPAGEPMPDKITLYLPEMSDTPKTDAAIMLASDADGASEVCALCYELERENAKLRALTRAKSSQ